MTASETRPSDTRSRANVAEQRPRRGPAIPHLALTVPDAEESAGWWCRIFGFVPVGRPDYPWPDNPGFAIVRHPASGLVLGFRRPSPGSAPGGSEYLSLRVVSEQALGEWADYLGRVGVARSPVKVRGDERYLSFTAPDGLGLELWWVPSG